MNSSYIYTRKNIGENKLLLSLNKDWFFLTLHMLNKENKHTTAALAKENIGEGKKT